MPLDTGSRVGRYEIRSKIGEGGMGEVYLARDTQLGRDVAIKVLPSNYSNEKERLDRFEQEACAASALNHPNILSIFDVGTHDGSPYVVSELLEGQTLRQRINGTALAQRKAIDYALQTANGLAAAHEKGIIHRDLKPENLFVTNDGRVKILDFGLAKLTDPGNSELSQSSIPTRRVDTDPGRVMGTVGYMSPEQVKGRNVDQRSDIFSFGAILYEMLSGRRAFHGESAAEAMSAVLKEDPPELSESNQRIPECLERLVNRCLEKNPEERFHSASDLAFALESLGSTQVSSQSIATSSRFTFPKFNRLLPWIIAAILALGLLVTLPFVVSSLRRAPARTSVIRATILPPEKMSFPGFADFAVSPDGSRLAFSAKDAGGQNFIWVRPFDGSNAQRLAGTEGASQVFWSPDGRFLGFFAQSKLKKIDASGGPPQTICDAFGSRGGTWNRDGVIVFGVQSGPLYRVSALGGAPVAVTKLDVSHGQTTHRWPFFLPDGKHFIYSNYIPGGLNENNVVYLGSLDSDEQRLILRGLTSVIYASGYLIFAQEGILMAQRFDDKNLQFVGDAFPIAERVDFFPATGRGVYSASENGILVYQSGSEGTNQLIWFDRSGKQIGLVGISGFYREAKLSPNDDNVAVSVLNAQAGALDVWLYELTRNVPTRFTFGSGVGIAPIWSPDGTQIVYASNRNGQFDLFEKAASGAGTEAVLFESKENKTSTSWSADGRFIAYTNADRQSNTKQDIWILPTFGDRKPFPFLQTPFNEFDAQFSPDGRWIAYVSDESGSNEVYVAPFPGPGGKREVSRDGGIDPRWRQDGKELYFLAADNKMMAADVKQNGDNLEIGNAQPLFPTKTTTAPGTHYDVSRDGKRFLVQTSGEGGNPPLTLVVNWTANLNQ